MGSKGSSTATRVSQALHNDRGLVSWMCCAAGGRISRRYFSRLAVEQEDDNQVKIRYDLRVCDVVLIQGESAVHLPVGVLAL